MSNYLVILNRANKAVENFLSRIGAVAGKTGIRKDGSSKSMYSYDNGTIKEIYVLTSVVDISKEEPLLLGANGVLIFCRNNKQSNQCIFQINDILCNAQRRESKKRAVRVLRQGLFMMNSKKTNIHNQFPQMDLCHSFFGPVISDNIKLQELMDQFIGSANRCDIGTPSLSDETSSDADNSISNYDTDSEYVPSSECEPSSSFCEEDGDNSGSNCGIGTDSDYVPSLEEEEVEHMERYQRPARKNEKNRKVCEPSKGKNNMVPKISGKYQKLYANVSQHLHTQLAPEIRTAAIIKIIKNIDKYIENNKAALHYDYYFEYERLGDDIANFIMEYYTMHEYVCVIDHANYVLTIEW